MLTQNGPSLTLALDVRETPPMIGHHMSIRTRDIHQAIAFYECLGFEMETQFTAGITLACWMKGPGGRLELIQIPEPKPAPDAFRDEHYVGYYHLSFDLTADIPAEQTLNQWVERFRAELRQKDLSTEVLLFPHVQTIGPATYEVTFLTDIDGLPLEFLRHYSSSV